MTCARPFCVVRKKREKRHWAIGPIPLFPLERTSEENRDTPRAPFPLFCCMCVCICSGVGFPLFLLSNASVRRYRKKTFSFDLKLGVASG